jgi:hypothetical protein
VPRPTGKRRSFSSFLPRGALYFAVALLASSLNVASVAAISTGEVADTVGSVVAPPTAPPPLQGVPPPQVPADPPASASGATTPSPNGSTVTGTADSLGAATDPPLPARVVGGANELAETAARTLTGAAQREPSELGSNGTPDGQAWDDNAGTGKGSFRSAKTAPPRRLVAYVWPAIALWPNSRHLTDFLAGLTGVDSLAIERAARLLSSPAGSVRSRSGSPLPSHPSTPNSPNGIPVGAAVSIGAKILFYLAMAVLLAMLALAIRRELDPAPRPPNRRR